MSNKFRHAILGGTFDHFHAGHKHFIAAGFENSEKLTIGLTRPGLAKNKPFIYSIESYKTREDGLNKFLKTNGYLKRVQIIPINDIFGTSLTDNTIDAIFVTAHGFKNAKIINLKRIENGLPELLIYKVEYLRGKDDLPAGRQGKVISSTRIRSGEIDRAGRPYINYFNQTLTLPENLRWEVSNTPPGKLIKTSSELLKSVLKARFVVAVGDVISQNLLKIARQADISIVDLKTKRGEFLINPPLKGITLSVRNDAKTINLQSVLIYKKAQEMFLSSRTKQILQIDGEEDLMALPATLLAPLGSQILYGKPDRGVISVDVTEDVKKEVLKVLNKFHRS